jgi:type I restriction enzyme, S subunit
MTSSVQYICPLCKKSFAQKIDFTRHQNKKSPCISLSEIEALAQNKIVQTDAKNILINVFKAGLNILRDNEGLTGEKALRNMSYFLILKLIEPHLGRNIDIDDFNYDFGHIEDDAIETHKNKLLSIVRFSNLANEPEDNIPSNMKYLWDDVLSVHPTTKHIFLAGKGFDIQYKSTYKKLIEKLNTLPDTENDVLGAAYEEVIQGIMTGKVLGQFFTQPLIKNMMVKLLDPQIHSDGTIETCGDPTMGTGGFLITYLKCILDQAKAKNISLNWEFIKAEGLYGKELEPDTYQLAVSNMLISSGQMFETFDRGDSIREPITRKFDNILANPPFGIKGLKYDDFQSPLKSEYVPIKTDNAVSLFIQAIIYMLKIGGKCAVVLPDGADLHSKNNATLVAIREFLLKTCDLKEVIYLPSGLFTYTSIKTCVFYFVKKREGTDVLNTTIKISKTQRETGRTYKFSKTHQTTKVRFYETQVQKMDGTDQLEKQLLIEVPIETLASNSYSLNYGEYMKSDVEELQYEEGIVVKTLGEVCKFKNGKGIKKDMLVDGEYPVIGGGQTPMGHHNEFNTNENVILCSSSGAYAGFISRYNKKSWASDCFSIIPINDMLTNDYLYYWLKSIQSQIYKSQTGAAQPHVYSKDFQNIKMLIPSSEKQQEITRCLDFVENANQTSENKIMELKKLNELCLTSQARFGNNTMKSLGDVCTVNSGIYLKSEMKIKGEYPVYGGGNAGFYINQHNRENEIIVAKDGVSENCIRFERKKFFLNHHGWTLNCHDTIIKKYLYYYLQSIQLHLLSIAKGAAQLGINQENFYKVKIPVPTLEKQQEIVEYCEANDALIEQLEQQMARNKSQFSLFK